VSEAEQADASTKIDQLIAGLNDWRGETLGQVRAVILSADPEIVEDWKWMGSPVWSRFGNLVVGNAHKNKVKLTFAQGASLPDPQGLFNNGLGGKVWRAIDLAESQTIDAAALANLVRAAVAFNRAKAEAKKKKA
jgi:hypothetical protein